MPTKNELLAIISAYGLGRVLPQGSTRAATLRVLSSLVKGGRVVAPVAARAAPVAGPVAVAGLAYEAQRRGLFDPIFDPLTGALMERTMPIGEAIVGGIAPAEEILRESFPVTKKRAKSAYSKAMSAGMKAVRASTSYGKKGTISNAKRAFAAVSKVASAAKKKKKAPKSGIRRKIYNAVRRYI